MRRLRPLSNKEVQEYVIQQPFGIDLAVNPLQQSFSELTWLEKSFSRAVPRSRIKEEKDFVYPAVFVEEGFDYYNLLELDNYGAYAFALAVGPDTFEDYVAFQPNVRSRRLDWIFWINLEKANPQREDDFIEQLKSEIVTKIENTSFLEVQNNSTVNGVTIKTIYDEPKKVFEGFSFDLSKTQFLYYPYRGLRFVLDVSFVEGCS